MGSKRALDEFENWLGAGLSSPVALEPAPQGPDPQDPVPPEPEPVVDASDILRALPDEPEPVDPFADDPEEPETPELEEITDRLVKHVLPPPELGRGFAPPQVVRVARFEIALSVRGRTDRDFRGTTTDVSQTGLHLRAPGPFALNQPVRVWVALPSGSIAEGRGTIVRVGRVPEAPAELDVGVRLSRASPAYQELLRVLAARR